MQMNRPSDLKPLKEYRLPPPDRKGSLSLETAIDRRESIRLFSSRPLSQSQLSQMLWAAQGTSGISRNRTVPSAGATYPLEIFIVCGENGVQGFDGGIYRYDMDNHSLSLHYPGEIKLELARAALGQKYIHEAPVNIVICAVYERTARRYGNRAERYVHMEIGHAGQNIYLQATALGLGTVAIGAFNDEAVREALQLDKQIRPLYIMPVGKPAEVMQYT
jgi:SagB-type dehydrogenase family enzyme